MATAKKRAKKRAKKTAKKTTAALSTHAWRAIARRAAHCKHHEAQDIRVGTTVLARWCPECGAIWVRGKWKVPRTTESFRQLL